MKVHATKTSAGKAKKVFLSLLLVLMGIGVRVFLGRFYVVQEFMFFVGLTALAVFIGVNLVVLGFLIHKAVRHILASIRLRKTLAEVMNEPHEQPRAVALLGAPVISRGERTGSA